MPRTRRGIVFDTNVLINMIRGECLSLLPRLPKLDCITLDEVVAEVTYPEQRVTLDAALKRGDLRCESITDIAALQAFAELRRVLGRGEAACLAFAQHTGALLASDDGQGVFCRMARARLGSDGIVTTPGVLLLAIRAELVTVDEADEIKLRLASRHFRMTFGSFRELLTKGGESDDNA